MQQGGADGTGRLPISYLLCHAILEEEHHWTGCCDIKGCEQQRTLPVD
jgi:hypothetical protein